MYAHAEVLIACRYCDIFGPYLVRGAQHGKGWDDSPSPNGLIMINRIRRLARNEEDIALIQKIEPYYFEPFSYWLGKMDKKPSPFDLNSISLL